MENREQRGEHREGKKRKKEKEIVRNEKKKKKKNLNRVGKNQLFIRLKSE
jgi:hypothetical protein